MNQPASLYDSPRLAAGYAFHRPPVHGRVIELVAGRLQRREPHGRGLDIGCGAGLSTAALGRLAVATVGLEPARAMLTYAARVAPRAQFVVGRAEALPFESGTFDTVAAAGALNYAEVPSCLAEVARVLVPGGTLVIYDFSSGRRSDESPGLEAWFDAFEREFPFPGGYEMDVQRFDFGGVGLRLEHFERYEVVLPLSKSAYLEYVLTESNVERAIREGRAEGAIRLWCSRGLEAVFERGTLPVAFTGYYACVRREG
jgi:SAM-dependent methyltransferase